MPAFQKEAVLPPQVSLNTHCPGQEAVNIETLPCRAATVCQTRVTGINTNEEEEPFMFPKSFFFCQMCYTCHNRSVPICE